MARTDKFRDSRLEWYILKVYLFIQKPYVSMVSRVHVIKMDSYLMKHILGCDYTVDSEM